MTANIRYGMIVHRKCEVTIKPQRNGPSSIGYCDCKGIEWHWDSRRLKWNAAKALH